MSRLGLLIVLLTGTLAATGGCAPVEGADGGVRDFESGVPGISGDEEPTTDTPGVGFDDAGDGSSPCQDLLERTCQPSCENSPGCNGANLLAALAPERCAEAESDLNRYPACVPNECEKLVRRVCGTAGEGAAAEGGACEGDPGCQAARALAAFGADAGPEERIESERACLQAGEDPDLFVTCASGAP